MSSIDNYLSDQVYFEVLKRKLELLKEQCNQLDYKKKDYKGFIKIKRCGKSNQYYYFDEKSSNNGRYLSKSEKNIALSIIQNRYEKKLNDILQKNISNLEKYIESYQILDEAYLKYCKAKREVIKPYRLLDEEYVDEWMDVKYEQKEVFEEKQLYKTVRGEMVRSKTEVMIADALYRYGVPYRYEYPVKISGIGTVHPDFYCLNIKLRKEIIWEHFGLMGEHDYSNNAVHKIERYAANGYLLGANFIATFESSMFPINNAIIEQNIKEYLL